MMAGLLLVTKVGSSKLAGWFFFTSMYGTVYAAVYALVLWIFWYIVKPVTLSHVRRALLLGPWLVSILVAFGLLAADGGSRDSAMVLVSAWGVSLAIGYGYVIVTELGLLIGKQMGFIGGDSPL
jgi:hypothetical protein